MNILCIIPARSGSKGLPNKNIINFKGRPLLAWSIYHAQQSKYNKQIKIIVSTDSKEYANIAKKWGAECPFLRPPEISGDLSTDFECIQHCVDWLERNEQYFTDFILHLRPTQPLRKIEDLDKCIELFIKKRNNYDSLRTVIPFKKSPYKMYRIKNDELTPLYKEINNMKEPYNMARQILPQCYLHNGYIDILNRNILKKGTISGDKIYAYVMNENDDIDIDYKEDLII
jgi:CMP-N-acetylneuraminic acid synthetase